MDARYASFSAEQHQDEPWNSRPPVKESEKEAEKEEPPRDRLDNQSAEAEADSNDALMETYNG